MVRDKMKTMTDLPVSSTSVTAASGGVAVPGNPIPATTPVSKIKAPENPVSVGGMSKEAGGGIDVSFSELTKNSEVGKDIELPKEVINAGVSQIPTVVAIPPVLKTHGVQPSGNNVTLGSGSTITLPLTDDQVNEGLKKSITDSWRWLALWCQRALKISLIKHNK
jgi:hypothetical protein